MKSHETYGTLIKSHKTLMKSVDLVESSWDSNKIICDLWKSYKTLMKSRGPCRILVEISWDSNEITCDVWKFYKTLMKSHETCWNLMKLLKIFNKYWFYSL